MYCPKCSQLQLSDDLQFCSRCGLPLSDLKEILADGKSKLKKVEKSDHKLSPRQKGTRQGAIIMLLSVILVPAYTLLAALFPAQDRLIESSVSDTPFEKISQAILLTIFMVGLARMLYARIFQPGAISVESGSEIAQLDSSSSTHALPPAQSIPVSGFGWWRANTGEIKSPSITEHTTKSLSRD
jgi:hypothetical protein